MKIAVFALLGMFVQVQAAAGQEDERSRRILERIERELERAHAGLVEDVERIVREEIRKAKSAGIPPDPSAELEAFAGKLKDDGGLNSRLGNLLRTREGRQAVLRELNQQGFKSVSEAVEHYCVRGGDGRLSIRPEHADDVRRWLDEAAPPPAAKRAYLGISAGDLSDDERRALGIGGGIRIAEVRGPAEKAGLKAGDILLSIGGVPVTEETIARTLERRRPGETVEVAVLRGRRREVFKLTLGERSD